MSDRFPSQDNPFDSSGEPHQRPQGDATQFVPQPGGAQRRSDGARPRPTIPRPAARPLDTSGPALPMVGATPLLAAAAPLLQLMGRLRGIASPPDLATLRDQASEELGRFAATADRLDLSAAERRDAHFALCAGIDDIVMNTGWGRDWSSSTLVAANHGNVEAGELFFAKLADKMRDPANHQDVLGLMFVCLSLGFQGRYRVGGRPNELEELRSRVHNALLGAGSAERALSPHWEGQNAPYVPSRASVPAWVIGAGVLACLGGLFFLLSILLGGTVDVAFANAGNSAPAMPAIQRPPEVRRVVTPPPAPQPPPQQQGPSAATTLRRFLEPEIAAGLVHVDENAALTTVRIAASGMFAPGSASVQANFLSLLQRIGDALNTEPGRVMVVGHTDNLPIRTARFPSNYQLSVARAEAARDIIAQKIREPARLTPEGRADQQPLKPNDTEQNRAANRRIEVVLRRQEQ